MFYQYERRSKYNSFYLFSQKQHFLAQSAGAVEYTNCTSAEEVILPTNECPRYGTKQSDVEFPVMLEL